MPFLSSPGHILLLRQDETQSVSHPRICEGLQVWPRVRTFKECSVQLCHGISQQEQDWKTEPRALTGKLKEIYTQTNDREGNEYRASYGDTDIDLHRNE